MSAPFDTAWLYLKAPESAPAESAMPTQSGRGSPGASIMAGGGGAPQMFANFGNVQVPIGGGKKPSASGSGALDPNKYQGNPLVGAALSVPRRAASAVGTGAGIVSRLASVPAAVLAMNEAQQSGSLGSTLGAGVGGYTQARALTAPVEGALHGFAEKVGDAEGAIADALSQPKAQTPDATYGLNPTQLAGPQTGPPTSSVQPFDVAAAMAGPAHTSSGAMFGPSSDPSDRGLPASVRTQVHGEEQEQHEDNEKDHHPTDVEPGEMPTPTVDEAMETLRPDLGPKPVVGGHMFEMSEPMNLAWRMLKGV